MAGGFAAAAFHLQVNSQRGWKLTVGSKFPMVTKSALCQFKSAGMPRLARTSAMRVAGAAFRDRGLGRLQRFQEVVTLEEQDKETSMTTDRWIALGAMLASVAAVFLSVSSDITLRKHMKLSVKPIPTILFTQTSADLYIDLENVSTGPIVLSEVSYEYKDGTVANTVIDPGSFSKGTAGEIVIFELDAESAVSSGSAQRLLGYDPEPRNIATQISST